MTTRQRVWTAGPLVALIWASLLYATAAWSQTGVDIPLDRIHRGDPGDRFLEAEIAATAEIGWTCGATLERRNNISIHAEDGHPEHGTNLIIESGANSVTFANIETESFGEATKAFVIDGDIKVYTQIGEDRVSSMGYLLEFECNPPTTTTVPMDESSTTTTTPTTSSTTSVPPVTTTTEPPPINGIDTGGGALQHLVAADPTSGDPSLWLIGGWAFLASALSTLVVVVWRAR